MSIERMQTVVAFTTEGVQKVLADLRALAAEQAKATGSNTALSSLNPAMQSQVGAMAPRAYNELERLQARQKSAAEKLIAATTDRANIVRKENETDAAFKARAARVRARELDASANLDAASENLVKGINRFEQEINRSADRERQNRATLDQERRDEVRASAERRRQMRSNAIAAFGTDDDRARQARTDLVAEERRAVADQREFNRRRRAQATEAFMQLPGDSALSQQELSQLTQTATRQPGDSDRVYRARELLADAQIQRATAESNFAEAVRRGAMGEYRSRQEAIDSINRARVGYDASNRRVTDSLGRLDRAIKVQEAAHAQFARTSMRESFLTGFRGRSDNAAPYAEQLGQAFKFSVFYGTAYKLLFGLTQTLAATFQEGVAFQEGMTNLALATGRPKEELDQIASELSKSATRAGFAPSQGVEIGARALGLYGAVDSDAATQNRVMQISSRVVNQLAVGSQKTPVDLQGDIAAIAQALGGGAASQFRIADLDAFMTKKFGAPSGSTLEVVAQSASVGKAAGFTDEQLFAIAADLLSRTGQSGSAVSGYMAQIFSRGGEGSLVDVARKRGIDPTQDLAQILEQLATQYVSAPGPEQAEISAAFGRGKIQNAAVALLSDYDEVLKRSGEALTEATGQADKQFAIRMDDIGGQLDLLVGAMRDFASQMGESGLLDVLGLGMVTFREFLEAVNGVLRLWNQLPNAIQDTIIGLAALAALSRTGLPGMLTRNVASRAGVGTFGRVYGPAGAVGNYVSTPGGVMPMGTRVLTDRDGTITPLRSAEGAQSLRKVGVAALGMIGPIGGAILGLQAIGTLKNSSDNMRAAQEASTAALSAPGAGFGSTSADFKSYAAELNSLATQNREATLFGLTTPGRADAANRLEAEAKRLERIAVDLAREEAKGNLNVDSSVFAGRGTEELTAGLEALEAGGATAHEQLAALRDILFGTADAADAAAAAFDRREFARQSATDVVSAATGSLAGIQPITSGKTSADYQAELTGMLTGAEAQRRLRRGLSQAGVQSEGDIDNQTATQIAAIVGEGYAQEIFGGIVPPEVVQSIQKKINRAIAQQLLDNAENVRQALSGDVPLTKDEAVAAANLIVERSETSLGNRADVDTRGQARVLQQRIRDLRRTQRSAGRGDIGAIQNQIADARRQLAGVQFEELERLRRIAQQNAGSKREIAAIGQRFLGRAIRTAVRGRDADLLVRILEQAGKGAVAMAQSAINDAIKIANAAMNEAERIMRASGYLSIQAAGYVDDQIARLKSLGLPVPQELKDQRGALDEWSRGYKDRRKLQGLKTGAGLALPATGDKDVYKTGSDSGNPLLDPETEKEKKDRDSAAAIAAARAAAFATRSQSGIASAKAAIQSARASIADAKKNTVEYWNAMGELFAAQQQLTEAVRAHRLNQMRLRGDITNPLFEARVSTREAAMRLRQDRASGAGADVIAQDRVDLREARANQEATAFSQRLQAVQTADELGRISHSKYINYLENEKRRLESIKNRSFQQQDQLDQIDRLLQDSAKEMQGQFNLGDIKLPTPYQVRRYIEQTSPARSERMAAGSYQQNTYLTINAHGANPPEIEATVRRVVGKGARVRTPSPRRRP